MLVIDKNICGGKLIVKGTRITYNTIISMLHDYTIFEMLENYPSLKIENIIECLNYYYNSEKV